jgi:hypothetical protein
MLRRMGVSWGAQQKAGYFKGDDDLMVDRLVFACAQQKKGLEVALPGFGRDLVPYFVPGDDEPSHSHINGELTVNPPTLQATPKKAKPVRTVTILKNGEINMSMPTAQCEGEGRWRSEVAEGGREIECDEMRGCGGPSASAKPTVS